MTPNFDDSFFAGWMGAEMMGLTDVNPQIIKKPLFSAIALRFEPTFDISPILRETIIESFHNSSTKIKIMLEFTEKKELKVWRKPKKNEEKPLMVFGLCTLRSFKKDSFFTITLRNEIGLPMILNISLLRNLLKKLKKNKVPYEIW